ncbi:MAG: preprotein translocase subunit SecE [Clostridia bacterium]|nr:preprotein translocase subunit SecE [Clostridia bacterium]
MSENEKIEGAEQDLETTQALAKPAKADKDKKAKADEKKSKPGIFQRIARWLREMKSELKKVMWPTPKQTLNNTLIVIACVIVVGICIWLFDALAGAVYQALLALVGKV